MTRALRRASLRQAATYRNVTHEDIQQQQVRATIPASLQKAAVAITSKDRISVVA
ncbi:MAG TPA: hypothetical protein VNZ94_09160 [Xanthobacteraceae bacterium]|nr:hypothetical protein [Xanthobacteraceae bacterium]